jgi:hypothetical protein
MDRERTVPRAASTLAAKSGTFALLDLPTPGGVLHGDVEPVPDSVLAEALFSRVDSASAVA